MFYFNFSLKDFPVYLLEMDRFSNYMKWLPEKMKEYNELMTTYTTLKERECAITGQSSTKKEKKERLLTEKENCTITKEGMAELEFMSKEEDLESRYRRNIRTVEVRKDNQMLDVESEYDSAEAKAKAIYDSSIAIAKAKRDKKEKAAETACEKAVDHYTSERDSSTEKLHREYKKQQHMFEFQKQKIEGERNQTVKTAAEITLEQDKLKILKQMQNIIKIIEVSRLTQVDDQYRHQTPLPPILPEPLITQYVEPVAVAVAPVAIAYDPNTPLPQNINSSSDLAKWEASATAGREMIRQQKLDLLRKEREIRIAQTGAEVGEQRLQQQYIEKYGRTSKYLSSGRPATIYGPIHVLENRPHNTETYVATPVRDEEELACTFFTNPSGSEDEA